MTHKKDIMEFWPFPYPPRPNQITALQWLQKHDAVKHKIIELPVGGGKSNIGLTYSLFKSQRKPKFNGDALILTPQIILQKQYEEDMSKVKKIELSSLYGKSNYACPGKKTSCDIGSLVKPKCENCTHTKDKEFAKISANTVLNYRLALTSFAFTETFARKRALVVLDECHTLESHLVNFDAVEISKRLCEKHLIQWTRHTDILEAVEWILTDFIPQMTSIVNDMRENLEPIMAKPGSELTKKEVKAITDHTRLEMYVDEVHEVALRSPEYIEKEFVLIHTNEAITLKRLTGAHTFKNLLLPAADSFLYMSSTVLNQKGFCEDLKMDPNDTVFLSLSSEFEPENRPIYYMPQAKMNAKWNTDENIEGRKEMLKSIRLLLDSHKDDSGILHTGNFAIAEWLVDELKNDIPHRIHHHNPSAGDDRNAVIAAFLGDNAPSVLISPSSTEGLDLKHDLGRFAIFAKIGFPNLGDQWIKKRMTLSSEWYQRQTMVNVIQGGGRVVRSSDDSGSVYILDSAFGYLKHRTNDMIPQWWKDSYIVI